MPLRFFFHLRRLYSISMLFLRCRTEMLHKGNNNSLIYFFANYTFERIDWYTFPEIVNYLVYSIKTVYFCSLYSIKFHLFFLEGGSLVSIYRISTFSLSNNLIVSPDEETSDIVYFICESHP